ncbi:MAG: indolepyruvate ferredoxin oxidoreductase [Gammaproteobacteria bacterium]|nr:MAG: indolepyruvate ferredoxin oxidoreductase [Gammaproteobacteria bacterium]
MSEALNCKIGQSCFVSGNEAVARAVWEAGANVAGAYPGTPSTEIIEYLSQYPDIYTEWSINEKVSMEVAIGASLAGSRAFCAMKHVGMNVASDAFMTQTLAGVVGGLVIAVADDVGLSSSQNEQDSRYWGRFAHLPILEPSDSQETYEMIKKAFDISEQFDTPVIVRLTTRICHVKTRLTIKNDRIEKPATGFVKDVARWVMTPIAAGKRLPLMFARDEKFKQFSETTELNKIENTANKQLGFIVSGSAYMNVKELYDEYPIFKLGFSYPLPIEKIKKFAKLVDKLIVAEEVEDLVETELKAAGIKNIYGKDILPKMGELNATALKPAINKLLGKKDKLADIKINQVFPRPPTMCVACPHLGPYFALAHMKNINITGDIGCYTLGAGDPWQAMDTCVSMGASMGVALGMDKGRGKMDEKKAVVAVIGDSTFLHMGMQGLLDITYNKGNVTVLLLDNRAVGMTGGQTNPGMGKDLHNEDTIRVDFVKLCEALGVKKQRIRKINPYELPTVMKVLREETKIHEPSVIITDQPCVLVDAYDALEPLTVIDEDCTGCGNCLDTGCPAIFVTRRETVTKPTGKQKELAFVRIDEAICTGCKLCTKPCAPDCIVPVE